MKIRKALLGAFALIVLSSALSGCVIVPVPYGHGGYYHYRR